VPLFVKWPGVIPQGIVINAPMAHEDWFTTIASALGNPDIKKQLAEGTKIGDTDYKVHLDGFDFYPYFQSLGDESKRGQEPNAPRRIFYYITDTGTINAVRIGDWKMSLGTIVSGLENAAPNLFSGAPQTTNTPIVANLRVDPFERFPTESMDYGFYWGEKIWTFIPTFAAVAAFEKSIEEFAPEQPPQIVDDTTRDIKRKLHLLLLSSGAHD
jgi:arylsulfatase A-like enzyme